MERHFPLSSIFFLAQSRSDKAIPLGQGQAAVIIKESSSQVYRMSRIELDQGEKRALRKKQFSNACEIAASVPAFLLRVTRWGRFWEEMEKVL